MGFSNRASAEEVGNDKGGNHRQAPLPLREGPQWHLSLLLIALLLLLMALIIVTDGMQTSHELP